MRYPDELIEEIRSRNDIVDVISKYVELKRNGHTYFGLCPFHNEKAPSFSVNPAKQMFYCFGCGVGGSVFSFLMKYDKLTFREAVQALAERAGVSLPEEDESPQAKRIRYKKKRLLEINEEAAKYFSYQLISENGKAGLTYLKDRCLSDEIICRFRLGYSNNLVKHLREKGYSASLMVEAGLASYSEQYGVKDKYWNRAMFPILDVNSKVIGFGGRVVDDGKPKYLNSPETLVFEKSRHLFGLNFAKHTRTGYIIICEGYMDVIAMHQAGFTMAVAALGTAFTPQQAQLLKKYTDTLIVSFDSDSAGTKAALRCIELAKKAGLTCKVLNLMPYKDPDEFLKNAGKEELQQRIDDAQNPFFYELSVAEATYDMSDPAEKTGFHKFIAQKLCEFNEPLERSNYLEAVAIRYSINKEALRVLVDRMIAEIEN